MKTNISARYKNSGFSLIEIMVSMAIFITVMGVIMSYVISSTTYTSRLNQKAILADNLRNANIRLEKEIEQCSAVLSSYTLPSTYAALYGSSVVYTNKNRIILARRVFKKSTYMPAPDPTPAPGGTGFDRNSPSYNDIIIIDYTGNYPSYNMSSTSSASTVQEKGKILISLIPAPLSSTDYNTSAGYIKRVLTSDIINSSDDKAYNSSTALEPFIFYDTNSTVISTATLPIGNTIARKISMVNIKLYGNRTYGNYRVRDNTDYSIQLRGYNATKS